MKVSEATGVTLDWMGAKCEGRVREAVESFLAYHADGEMNYSTDWSQGGPIIEREEISVTQCNGGWEGITNGFLGLGRTPLIAAMRAFVASKLGEEVEVPKELK